MKKFEKEIIVEIKQSFLNPINNRMAQVGDHMRVPNNQFWLRRLAQKDCAKAKSLRPKKAQEKVAKKELKAEKKG